jgi:hypothetical protein
MHEPTSETIANHLYDARNLLAHNLGIDDATWRTRHRRASRRRSIALVKPREGMAADDVVELETYATPPFAGEAVTLRGLETRIFVPGLHWAVGRMLRAAIDAGPAR